MKISVAAVPYFWSKEDYQNFYHKLAQSKVDIVYLGETICSKRRSMKLEDWLEVAEMLTEAGKEVVLSTLTLLEADSELKSLTKIAEQKAYLIEANDTAAIQVASRSENSFVTGSPINLYNNRSLTLYKNLGMKRWNVPVELGKEDLLPMISFAKELEVEIEYQVFGRMQLASSARCFTARHHQLAKDDCQFKCLEDEQGILVKTQEGDSFAQINGIQTQSAKLTSLLSQWKELESAGVDILRIVPVSAADTLKVVNELCQMVCSNSSTFDHMPFNDCYEFCNGYWYQIEGMKYVS
jgi:O2-independent ubiquinone biosynthesis protein UbiV